MSTKLKTNDAFVQELRQWLPHITPLDKYVNNRTKIRFKCKKHNEVFMSTPKQILKNKSGCPKCQSETRRNNLLRTNAEFLQLLKRKNIDVVPLETYRGGSTPILFRCSCGDLWRTTPERVLLGNHCKKCGYKKFCGENNHFYNPKLTDEDRQNTKFRFRNPGYKNFVRACFERDNYTCQITGKKSNGDIAVHHLNGYNWDVKNRLNVDNGITLNEEIHKEFHSLYGKGGNTKAQFIEFITMLLEQNRISVARYQNIMDKIKVIK